jgi:hypothetical protein
MNTRILIALPLAAALIEACLEERQLDELTATPLGMSGGSAVSPDGRFQLTVPAGTLGGPTTITIAEDRTQVGGNLVSPIYKLGPSATPLTHPVQVAIRYPAGSAPAQLYLATLETSAPARLGDSAVDTSRGVVSATVNHFAPIVIVDGAVPMACHRSADAGILGGASHACLLVDNGQNSSLGTAQPLGLSNDDGVDVDIAWSRGQEKFYSFTIPDGARGSLLSQLYIGPDEQCAFSGTMTLSLLDASGVLLSKTGSCPMFNYAVDPAVAGLYPGTYDVHLVVDAAASSLDLHFALYLLGPDLAPNTDDAGIYTDGGVIQPPFSNGDPG